MNWSLHANFHAKTRLRDLGDHGIFPATSALVAVSVIVAFPG